MKIAMDSGLLHLYERMLNPSDRQKEPRPNLRYSANDKKAFDIIDALEKIYKSGARFCKLPSNEEVLKQNTKTDKNLPECCVKGFDIQKISRRKDELQDFHEDLEDRKLLAEAEECGVNILLTTIGSFKENLQGKAKNNVRIFHPIDYANGIAK
jgi:hypothetical protein